MECEVLFSRKKGLGTHMRFWDRIITFVLHIDIKYTNKQSLGRKDEETAFPLKKALVMCDLVEVWFSRTKRCCISLSYY